MLDKLQQVFYLYKCFTDICTELFNMRKSVWTNFRDICSYIDKVFIGNEKTLTPHVNPIC